MAADAKTAAELERELQEAYAALGTAVVVLAKHGLLDEWSALVKPDDAAEEAEAR